MVERRQQAAAGRVIVGCDHAGFKLKEALKQYLDDQGYDCRDCGAHEYDPNDDFPDYGSIVCEELLRSGGRGILLDGTGQGMARVANKHPGIDAAVCWDLESARKAREHGNANVLCLGGWALPLPTARKIVDVWLREPFRPRARYLRRIQKIREIEARCGLKLPEKG